LQLPCSANHLQLYSISSLAREVRGGKIIAILKDKLFEIIICEDKLESKCVIYLSMTNLSCDQGLIYVLLLNAVHVDHTFTQPITSGGDVDNCVSKLLKSMQQGKYNSKFTSALGYPITHLLLRFNPFLNEMRWNWALGRGMVLDLV